MSRIVQGKKESNFHKRPLTSSSVAAAEALSLPALDSGNPVGSPNNRSASMISRNSGMRMPPQRKDAYAESFEYDHHNMAVAGVEAADSLDEYVRAKALG